MRYYFDIDDGKTVTADEIGTEISSKEVLRETAMRAAKDIAMGLHTNGDEDCIVTVKVRDHQRRYIFAAVFSLHGTWLTPDTWEILQGLA